MIKDVTRKDPIRSVNIKRKDEIRNVDIRSELGIIFV